MVLTIRYRFDEPEAVTMAQKTAELNPTAENVSKTAVAETLDGYPVKQCKNSTGLDHMDDEAIFIEVELGLIEQPFDSERDTALSATIRERLCKLGEYRYPDINIVFHRVLRCRTGTASTCVRHLRGV